MGEPRQFRRDPATGNFAEDPPEPRIVIFATRRDADGNEECRFDVTTESGRDDAVAKWSAAGFSVYSGPCESDIVPERG